MQRLIERSGLIVERRRDVISFAHHTFQEYFVAQYLARKGDSQNQLFLAETARVLSDWWREVILLYVGLLPDATDFILRFYDSAPDDIFRQRLRLAGLCVGEAVEVKDVVLRRKIIVELLNNRTLGQVNSVEQDLTAESISFLIRWAGDQSWYVNAILTRVKAEGQSDAIKSLLLSLLEMSGNTITCVAVLKSLLLLPDLCTDEIVKSVIILSSSKDLEIRQNAVACLGVIGKTKMTKEITQCLTSVLGDVESIRDVAIRSLQSIGNIGEGNDLAYAKLDEMFRNRSRSVRFAAVRAFPVLAVNPPPELIDHFVNAIIDPRISRSSLQEELSKLRGVALGAVTTKLFELAGNHYGRNRVVTIYLLSTLPEEIIRQYKIVERLLSLLGSGYQPDREYACLALCTLIDRSLANDVFEGLLLGRVSDIEKPRKTIQKGTGIDFMPTVAPHKLIDLVPNDNGPMRAVAIRLLGKLDHCTPSSDDIDTLQRFVYDKRDLVRTAAIHALMEQTETVQTEEVITRLLNLAKRRNIFGRFMSWVSNRRTEPYLLRDLKNYRLASIDALGLFGISQKEKIVDLVKVEFESEIDFEIQQHITEMLLNLSTKSPSLELFEMIFDEMTEEVDFYIGSEWRMTWSMGKPLGILPSRLLDSSATLASQLPEADIVRRMLDALVSDKIGKKTLSLLILKNLRKITLNELVINQVCLNLDDSRLIIRTAALDVVEKALSKSTAPGILSALNRRLLDDMPEVREKAWLLIEKWYTGSGRWISLLPTTPAAVASD